MAEDASWMLRQDTVPIVQNTARAKFVDFPLKMVKTTILPLIIHLYGRNPVNSYKGGQGASGSIRYIEKGVEYHEVS